jgi:hypothetical protein
MTIARGLPGGVIDAGYGAHRQSVFLKLEAIGLDAADPTN